VPRNADVALLQAAAGVVVVVVVARHELWVLDHHAELKWTVQKMEISEKWRLWPKTLLLYAKNFVTFILKEKSLFLKKKWSKSTKNCYRNIDPSIIIERPHVRHVLGINHQCEVCISLLLQTFIV
jgi:hypothetical protein